MGNLSGKLAESRITPVKPEPLLASESRSQPTFRTHLETAGWLGSASAGGACIHDLVEKIAQKQIMEARQEAQDLYQCWEFSLQNNKDFEAGKITSETWASKEIVGGITKGKIMHPRSQEFCKIAIPIPKKVKKEDVYRVHQASIQPYARRNSQIGNTGNRFASISMGLNPSPPPPRVVQKVIDNQLICSACLSFFVVFSASFSFLVIRDFIFPPKREKKENLSDFSDEFQLEKRLEKIEKQLEKTSLLSITLQLSEKVETGVLTKEKAERLLRKFSFSEEQISFILS